MTVASTKSTNVAASARLSKAISKASAPAERPEKATTTAPATAASPAAPRTRTAATESAMRGAKAAPEAYSSSGASYAAAGNQNVMSVAPGMSTAAASQDSGPYTPYAASMDSYVHGGGPSQSPAPQIDSAPEPVGTDAGNAPQVAPNQAGSEVHGTGTEPITGTGAWSPDWQRRFEKLQLAPADVAYLAQAGFDDNELFDIAMELERVDLLDADAPQPGMDAGSTTSANGPLPTQPGQSAWTPQWEQKFTDVMQRMGMSESEIAAQLAEVEGVPISEEQLTLAYEQMAGSVGDFDDAWKRKFETLLDELKTPAADKAQIMEQLAAGGLTAQQLEQAYSQMEAAKPAWNKDWENQFKALEIPDEMLKQLAESGAPKEALEQQLQALIDTKMKFKEDGRLEKLQDAKATNEEKWAIMTQDLSGKEFDKVVEQVRSSHVPAWKRVLSFGVNLIPGVYALQFVTGKDWVTGDKIDRTNPLNIVGAVASGFAGFTAVRGAIQGVQGLTAANAAFKAGTATAGLKNAATAANLLPKLEKGLRFTDYLKSAVPIVNRFGEAGRLSALGRGYFQSMQLASGTAALTSVAGGGSTVNAASKAQILDGLKQGKSIDAAIKAAGVSGQYADEAALAFKNYGFLQGGVGRFVNGSGNFTFNPFKNRATISAVEGAENVFALGSKVNFATKGGLAQGIGAIRGAEYARNLAQTGAASVATGGANIGAARGAEYVNQATSVNPMLSGGRTVSNASGLGIADDVQRIATMDKTALMAAELGVGGGKFRSLLQLGNSNRQAARIASIMDNGASTAYRVGRHTIDTAQRVGGYVATPLVGGAALGMTGKQMQPAWDYWKDRDAIRAEEAELREAADREAEELERLYQERQQQGAAPAATQQQAAPAPAAQAPTTGSTDVYVDPVSGFYVDPVSGLRADPATGQVYDTQGQLVGTVGQQTQPVGG